MFMEPIQAYAVGIHTDSSLKYGRHSFLNSAHDFPLAIVMLLSLLND